MSKLDPDYCKETVYGGAGFGRYFQCSRKAVKDGYCKQHHPDSVKARQEKSEREYEEKRKNEPWYLLKVANGRIKELEIELESLRYKLADE